MTHSYVCHDLFLCVTVHICAVTHSSMRAIIAAVVACCSCKSHVCHDSFIRAILYTVAMSHSYVWYNSFICVTWLIHMCDITHSYVWHYIPVPWQIQESRLYLHAFSRDAPENHKCDMTHSYVWYCIRMPWHMHSCAMTQFISVTLHTCAITHVYVCHDSSICVGRTDLFMCERETRCSGMHWFIHVWETHSLLDKLHH